MASDVIVRMMGRRALLAPLLASFWVGLGVGAGCGDDGGGGVNVLPTASASGTSTSAGTTEAATTEVTADTTAGVDPTFPATYRFDCIDIITVGDGNGDGMPDGEAIQATLLENTWTVDIEQFKLNILLTVRERDEAGGTATLSIGSGIGTGTADQCVEPTTASPDQSAGFDPDTAVWQPGGEGCVEPAADGAIGATYTFETAASDTIYIYAQDDDATPFNCVPGGSSPNAVPLHAITSTVTVDANDQVAAGQLTGCLVDAEAQALCSCLGECAGAANPACGGCPDGSTPLATLLGGVGPTDRCTELMGETAYDLTVGFTTTRLPVAEPTTCGS